MGRVKATGRTVAIKEIHRSLERYEVRIGMWVEIREDVVGVMDGGMFRREWMIALP